MHCSKVVRGKWASYRECTTNNQITTFIKEMGTHLQPFYFWLILKPICPHLQRIAELYIGIPPLAINCHLQIGSSTLGLLWLSPGWSSTKFCNFFHFSARDLFLWVRKDNFCSATDASSLTWVALALDTQRDHSKFDFNLSLAVTVEWTTDKVILILGGNKWLYLVQRLCCIDIGSMNHSGFVHSWA